MILFDADKLEMAGAVGVARAVMYCADKGMALVDESAKNVWSVARGDMEFAKSRLFTPEARALAAERLEFMESFLEQLKHEADV